MAGNMFRKYSERRTARWEVGTGVKGGSLIVDPNSGEVGVTIADSGGSTVTINHPDGSVTTKPSGGVGYDTGIAVVARDGSWLFPVAGVTNGDTVPNSAAGTNRGTPVYQADDKSLTLTATDNTYVGKIDVGAIVGGIAPVEIGVAE